MWCEVLKHRYNGGRDFSLEIPSGNHCSHLWNDLLAIWTNFSSLCVWNVGDGTGINFLRDKWVDSTCVLVEVVHDPDSISNWDLEIDELIDDSGNWDLSFVENLLPSPCLAKIKGKHPHLENVQNFINWGLDPSGVYYVKSYYKHLMKDMNEYMDVMWKMIWGCGGIERI